MGHPLSLVDRLAVALAATAAGITFTPAFDERGRLIAAIAVTAAVATVLVPSRRAPKWTVLLALPALFGGCLAAVLWLRQPVALSGLRSPAGWAGLGDVLLGGVGRTLRLTLPLPAGLAVVPLLLTGVAATTGAFLVRRHAGDLTALVPAAMVGTLGVVAAGARSSQAVPVILGFAAATVLLVRGVARYGGRRVLAAAGGVLLAGLPLLVLPARPGNGVADLRERLRAPDRVVTGVDLLDEVSGWLSRPDREMFRAGDGTVLRWRLATLDRYDGETWTSSARFTPAGLGVPPYTGAVPRTAVVQDVRISGLAGPYLPAADRPVRVTAPASAVDPDDGVLVSDRPLTDGTSYRVVSVPRVEPTVPAGAVAAPGTTAQLAVPAELNGDLQTLIGRAGVRPDMSSRQRADAVQQYLRNRRRNVLTAPGAASIAAIRDFIGGVAGTTVQFAVTFALAMRVQQVPARLVVGFLPRRDSPSVVLGRDARVWVELRYAGIGWVTYQPTPAPVTADAPLRSAGNPPPVAVATPAPQATPAPYRRPAAVASRVFPVLLVLLAVVAGYLLAVLLAPAVRRWSRRRRRGTPDERVVRAWQDVLDELAADAVPVRTMTPTDVRQAVDGRTADPAAAAESRRLAVLADRALFGPRPSTDDDRHAAWQAATRLRRALRGSRSRGDRWRGRLHPARLRPPRR